MVFFFFFFWVSATHGRGRHAKDPHPFSSPQKQQQHHHHQQITNTSLRRKRPQSPFNMYVGSCPIRPSFRRILISRWTEPHFGIPATVLGLGLQLTDLVTQHPVHSQIFVLSHEQRCLDETTEGHQYRERRSDHSILIRIAGGGKTRREGRYQGRHRHQHQSRRKTTQIRHCYSHNCEQHHRLHRHRRHRHWHSIEDKGARSLRRSMNRNGFFLQHR